MVLLAEIQNFNIADWFTQDTFSTLLRVLFIILLGLPFFKIVSVLTGRIVKNHFSPQNAMLARKSVFYGAA